MPQRPHRSGIPYAPIERHAVLGDRRTAALVAADGTIDWLCLPDYADDPTFGALLDADHGGAFRFGPVGRAWGRQRYEDDTAVVETRWDTPAGELVAHDAMVLLEDDDHSASRVVVRHLVARGDRPARCVLEVAPRGRAGELQLFFSRAEWKGEPIVFELRPGEEAWAVLAYADASTWTIARARAALDETRARWRRWMENVAYDGPRAARVRRSLLTIRLLGYAPAGVTIAAPTTSLPERIGGDWNADYRLSWVRDASLCLASLAKHGDCASSQPYFDALLRLASKSGAPLQVLYEIHGGTRPHVHERDDFAGYRGSRPVRFGNHAYEQKQLGMFGFLADCAATYRRHGGAWRPEYFDLIARCADWVRHHWDEKDNGIWELSHPQHHVSSRVMSWVALERASSLAAELGHVDRAAPWRAAMEAIRAEVLERGWSERMQAFRQEYGRDNVDASSLLVPIFRFLPGDDPRVIAGVDRVAERLTIEGHVYRFDPLDTPGVDDKPMGELEGSFILCTCWLASAYAIGGRVDLAERTLDRVDRVVGELGLMPEGIDARTGGFLGNYPLLFAHAEYVRAVTELARATRGP